MVVRNGVKRQKIEGNANETTAFASGRDVHFSLRDARNVSQDAIRSLRNQSTVRHDEVQVASDDSRLRLVREWLENSPGAEDLFGYLETNVPPATFTMCIAVLSSTLTLTSAHFDSHAAGLGIVRKLLSPVWIRRIQALLSGSHADSILVTLKLVNSISSFAGGRERKTLLDVLPWDVKVFHKLLVMRRKGKTQGGDIMQRPDIRTLSLQLILSFISRDSSAQMKNAFLEQRRDIFLGIFKGLSADPYAVVRYVLEDVWLNLWQDPKIRRSTKIGLFGEATIQYLLKLYERSSPDETDSEDVPADLVHHFMLGIATHRGVGVCFADNGWYPRSSEEDQHRHGEEDGGERQHTHRGGGGKVYNKILSNVLKMLKVNEDPRQQELALKILAACPELVAGYLLASGITMDPRLSSRWLVNIGFLGSVISLPVPFESFYIPLSRNAASSSSYTRQFRPNPPPLSTIVENILPSMSLKTHFTKGLQSTSSLVQHTTAVTLAKCLQKCEDVLNALDKVRDALEEDDFAGQWSKRRQDVVNEVRKRLPDFQVIIAFSQQKAPSGDAASSAKHGLLAEVAQRLLWLYHRCVPAMVAEVTFEVGKSLQGLWCKDDPRLSEGESSRSGLSLVQQLLVLRMLEESAQFSWSAKSGAPGTPSNIAILLQLHAQTEVQALKDVVQSLLEHTFASSPLFHHDPNELRLWLSALPTSVRAPGTECPDGVPLTCEIDSVVFFLEDCFQRCSKSVYRYLEDLNTFMADSEEGSGSDARVNGGEHAFSPLMMTAIEQLTIKAKNGSLSPSDLLALATYFRKLIVKLLGTQDDLRVMSRLCSQITKAFSESGVYGAHSVLKSAISRELEITKLCVSMSSDFGLNEDVQLASLDVESQIRFLSEVERLPLPDLESERKVSAYELVDWARLLNQELRIDELKRLANAVLFRHPPALRDLLQQVPPQSNAFWQLLSEKAPENLVSRLDFDWLLVHLCRGGFVEEHRKTVLSACLEHGSHPSGDYKRYIGYILLNIDPAPSSSGGPHLLDVATLLLEKAKLELTIDQFKELKVFLIQENPNFDSLIRQNNCSRLLSESLDVVIGTLLDPALDSDRDIASSVSSYWADALQLTLSAEEQAPNFSRSFVWLKFMAPARVLSLTAQSAQTLIHNSMRGEIVALLDSLFSAVELLEPNLTSEWFSRELGMLIQLYASHSVARLERVLAKAINGSVPYGLSGLAEMQGRTDLSTLLHHAQARWSSRLTSLDASVNLEPLFSVSEGAFNADVSAIFEGLIYRSREARGLFWRWLKRTPESWNSPRISHPLHAYLDTFAEDGLTGLLEDDESSLAEICAKVARQVFETSFGDLDMASIHCCRLFLQLSRHKRNDFAAHIRTMVDALSVDELHEGVVQFGNVLNKQLHTEHPLLSESLAKHALNWTIRHLSEVDAVDDDCERRLLVVCDLMKRQTKVLNSIAETTIGTIIRNHISSSTAVRLAYVTFKCASLKPVTVNRLLQSIVQHPNLHRECALDARSPSARDSVVQLLSGLFHAHPENTCQPSHIQPLIQLYGGTWSTSDRRLFAIFRLFEQQGKGSVSSLFTAWSPSPAGGASPNQRFMECMASLEPTRVFRTCLDFPRCRVHDEEGVSSSDDGLEDCSGGGDVYDPLFVNLLFCQALLEGPPDSSLSWVQLFRSNVVSLIVRSLSSADDDLRRLALAQMRILWKMIENATMQETKQVAYVLGLLRSLYQENAETGSEASVARLPSFVTLLLAHALRAIFYPSNFIYPLTSKFLLQRPEMDPTDVPMLYGMLFSSSDDWKRERAWMLRFLSDGMLSSEDWRILKRRHTWDLLASLFQRSVEDKQLRRSVLEVLATLTCHRQATTSLVLKLSLIQWIESQLISIPSEEAVAWVKIIENIAVVVDQERIDQLTRRGWRTGLLRCLKRLTQTSGFEHLLAISRTTLRLCLSSDSGKQEIREVTAIVQSALVRIVDWESQLHVPLSRKIIEARSGIAAFHGPPHGRGHLFEISPRHNFTDLDAWTSTVDMLWNVTMVSGFAAEAWNALTWRLLVVRALSPSSEAGEWARREVVRNLVNRRP